MLFHKEQSSNETFKEEFSVSKVKSFWGANFLDVKT